MERIKCVKKFLKPERDRAIFRVHFRKLGKNDFKSAISFKAPTNLPSKN